MTSIETDTIVIVHLCDDLEKETYVVTLCEQDTLVEARNPSILEKL